MTMLADIPARLSLPRLGRLRGLTNATLGIGLLLVLWWLGGRVVANDPDMFAFADFAPAPTLSRLWEMIVSGDVIGMSLPSSHSNFQHGSLTAFPVS